ncbi:hypothetical protein QCM77_35630 [Bradyrhizobium sp. SSUT18]|uniref:hypothetical protein n=1 Tax=Bradyrhizobium sp. SSUT18 TaxID=3040602 RepID=UPI00244AE452|nr:hypothetical protein [Bradyrhizobium sp. SSUT18]MDH2405198.1 hypothetical protein [Bradyrhizobium sp. SSUT18]
MIARRFRCDADLCGRQIFIERFGEGYWLHRRDARRGWTLSSIISVWRLLVGRQRTLQNG